ncbi:hypothetical protein HYH02_007241 [Chlamydomonas schloesseri]|uniref:BTB domain-containing protein n=1 Tax=Chlamydomonas schloesseri TaxID=2026947 RepID=A0A835WIB8_9CHLO|nr:hypothetical protein HYH02_007241 [Chlamydomonas schloesseri]|eukprot:KAG2447784.1 hypothetical protein HYH02_007241 [Chlamydomonas schloesseri]
MATASPAAAAGTPAVVPPSFSEYAASIYGTHEAADCLLRFYVSQTPSDQEQAADSGGPSRSSATSTGTPQRTFVGEPLPAHSLILRGSSLRLRALLSRWTGDNGMSRSGSGALPELHVLLDSAEDLGPASEVLRFCYTGQLQSCGFRPLLLVRRQASYLQVLDCAATCDKALEDLASAMVAQTESGEVIAAFGDHLLFPDPGLEPGFRPVQHALTAALLTHFGCAFGTMSSWARLQQWMQLPEVAVAWALASEELSTDEESSVLLLVLWWLHWQQHEAGALGWDEAGAAGRRLCQHVRLGCLSRPFLLVLLPQLEWLQLTPAQFAAVVGLGTAGGAERAYTSWALGRKSGAAPPAGGAAAWYRGPRKQSPAAAQPLKVVRHFTGESIRRIVRVEAASQQEGAAGGNGNEEDDKDDEHELTRIDAGDGEAWSSDAPWHHDSGYPHYLAAQPPSDSPKPQLSPWAGGAVYQGGFFWLPELACRVWPRRGPRQRPVLRLCLAAHEALPMSLRDRMRRHAFASVEAAATVTSSSTASTTGVVEVGVPVPVRGWWSHEFRYAAKAVTAVMLPLSDNGADRLWSWEQYLTDVDGSAVLVCDLELAPRPAPGAAVAPVAGLDYHVKVLAGIEVLGLGEEAEDGSQGAYEEPEWDWNEETTEEEEWVESESEEEDDDGSEDESEWEEDLGPAAVQEEVQTRGSDDDARSQEAAVQAEQLGQVARGEDDGCDAIGDTGSLADLVPPPAACSEERTGGHSSGEGAVAGPSDEQLASETGSPCNRANVEAEEPTRSRAEAGKGKEAEDDEGLEEGPDKAIYLELLRRHDEMVRQAEEAAEEGEEEEESAEEDAAADF